MPLGSLLGPLEALLGGLWTQKCVKTLSFLRVLKRLFFGFEAPDGPLGLILAASWANLVPKWGHEMGNKSAADRYQKMGCICLIRSNNKSGLVQFLVPFWTSFGAHFGTHFEPQNWSKIC